MLKSSESQSYLWTKPISGHKFLIVDFQNIFYEMEKKFPLVRLFQYFFLLFFEELFIN